MKTRTPWQCLAAAIAAISSTPTVAQVDMSCIGVQVMSVHMRVHRLGHASAAYAPLIEKVEELQRSAANTVNEAEEALMPVRQRIKNANPRASDAEIHSLLLKEVRQSAEVDNNFAKMLVAQVKAHKVEEQIIVEGRQIPDRENARQVSHISRLHAEQSGLSRQLVENIERSQTLQHLVGTLAAAKAAVNAPEIPSAPLARMGFDTTPGEARLVAVTQAASTLVAQADAKRQGGELIVDHLTRLHGTTADRVALMRDRSKESTRVTNVQIATALIEMQKADDALKRIGGIKLDPPAQPSGWVHALTEKVSETVGTVYEYVYGTPQPNANRAK
jgi:hypothetical protein